MAEPSRTASAPQLFMIALAALGLLGEATAEAAALLAVDDAQGLLLLREGLEVEVDRSTPRLQLLITTAEQASAAGDPELALRLLRTAARRCWWSDPGRELRERVALRCGSPGSPSRPSVWSHGANVPARNSARRARAASVKAVPTGTCSRPRSSRSPSSQRKASPTRR
ncbi:hypothetical protein [Streptomyces gelaticus]|uniref:hypothetical protein n=1 Tax=Streptomyces gelaticus TaxID=285446 RepID=UPI001E3BC567|nr:hypothetical protein [Streptomyces gelaticus]